MTESVAKWLNKKFLDWQSASEKRQTIGDFAKMLGVSQGALGHWMNGIRFPQGENVDKLAVLGPEIYDILGLARPDPVLFGIVRSYDKVILDRRDHFAVAVKQLAELQEKIELDELEKVTYILRAKSEHGHVVEVIRDRPDYEKLKEMFKDLSPEEKKKFVQYIQGEDDD